MKKINGDGFTVYREEPPKKVNHGVDWAQRVSFIKDLRKPGVWYVIGEFEGTAARQTRTRCARTFPDMEFISNYDKATNASKLYTRMPK